MTVAEDARAAVDRHPFLRAALRAGVVNYTAAARFLDLGADEEAVAAALRRYAEDLPDYERPAGDASVRMQSGVARVDGDDALLSVNGVAFAADGGSLTAVVVTGGIDESGAARALGVLDAEGVAVEAAGFADDGLVVVVGRRDGANAVRAVEDAL